MPKRVVAFILLLLFLSASAPADTDKLKAIIFDAYLVGEMTLVGQAVSVKGGKYILMRVKIVNNGSAAIYVNPDSMALVDSEGYSYHYDMDIHNNKEREIGIPGSAFPAIDLAPGSTAEGWIVFQIPIKHSPKELVYKPAMFGEELRIDCSVLKHPKE